MSVLWDTVWNSDDPYPQHGDWALSGSSEDEPNNRGGFQDLDDLGTAILLALYSDARLPDSMVGTNGFTVNDQFQWHGNTFGIEEDEGPLGSLLWTLERAPLSDYTGKTAVHYAAEALQVLVKNHWCTGFNITHNIVKAQGRLELTIIPLGLSSIRTYYADLFPLQ